MKISRRDFVAYSSGLLSSFVPFLDNNKNLLQNDEVEVGFSSKDRNILVLIHLAGGNDWFNTIIPYTAASYYDNRPSLAISANESIKLDRQYALHPSLREIKNLYDKSQVAILLDAGYAQKTLSHHRAIENMQYALFDHSSIMPWQGYYKRSAEQHLVDKLIFPAINVEPKFSKPDGNEIKSQERIFISSLASDNKFKFDLDCHYRLNESTERSNVISATIKDLCPSHFSDTTVRQLSQAVSDDNHNGFGRTMSLIAKLILNKTNAAIYHISLGGFDTHVNQSAQHAHLLSMLSKAIASFQSGLEAGGIADKVLTIVCSEFGRSYVENDSSGTDHGYMNHVLAIGRSVSGGIYGNQCK